MQFSKLAVTSALGITAGTVHADPVPAPAPVIPSRLDGINQALGQVLPSSTDAKLDGDSVVVETAAGSVTAADNQLQVRDNQGNIVTGLPLSHTLGGIGFGQRITIRRTSKSSVREAAHPWTPLMRVRGGSLCVPDGCLRHSLKPR
ncbi:hypothetical protein [Nocardia sp. NPDC004123]